MSARGRTGARRVPWQIASIAAHAAAVGGALWLARPPLAEGALRVIIANPPAEIGSLRAPRVQRPPATGVPPVARAAPAAKRPQRRGAVARSSRPAPAGPLAAALPVLDLAPSRSRAPGELAFAGEGSSGILASVERIAWRSGFDEGSAGEDGSAWLREHYREIVRRIQSRIADEEYYPWSAQLHGREGLVRVAFTLRRDGTLGDVRVTTSSGHRDLDRCAVAAVRDAAPFPRPPRDEAVVVPITFVLL